MPVAHSPLRYPGGKAILSPLLAATVAHNNLQDGTYAEPYAGGAGAALSLLFGEHVQRIVLNDADPCVYAFWSAVLHRKNDLVARVRDAELSIPEWRRQRAIYLQQHRHSRIKVAFAAFYLNRCNRSGIMVNGGPIGGYEQSGTWKLDARFNRDQLIERIEKIHTYKERIGLYNLDAIDFLEVLAGSTDSSQMLVYLDPPYFVKGRELYLNHYQPADHAAVAKFITTHPFLKWIMTYDDVPEIRALYSDCRCAPFTLSYSAHSRKVGRELLIHDSKINLPEGLVQLLGPAQESA